MKELRKIFDPSTGKTWHVNTRTRIVRDSAGDFPDDATAQRLLRKVESRVRSQRGQRARDEALRSLGMVRNRDGSWE